MEKIKKIIILAVSVCILMVPFASTASATEIGSDIGAIIQYFGYDLTPEGLSKMFEDIRSGGLGGMMSLLGFDVNDILSEIQEYLNAFESEVTTAPTTEPSTEETTTEAPSTEAPTTSVQPSYQYTPPVTVAPTQPVETTTYTYVPPQIYTEPASTVPFQPDVNDNTEIENDVKPIATAVGVLLLLAASAGVFVVVVALKKNKI